MFLEDEFSATVWPIFIDHSWYEVNSYVAEDSICSLDLLKNSVFSEAYMCPD